MSSAVHSYLTAFQNLYVYIQILLHIHGGPCSNLVSSPHQMSPLHWAAREGHVDTVEYLVGARGDINITDDGGVSE